MHAWLVNNLQHYLWQLPLSPGGATGTHRAAYCGHSDVVSVLVREGVEGGRTDSDGKTPLHKVYVLYVCIYMYMCSDRLWETYISERHYNRVTVQNHARTDKWAKSMSLYIMIISSYVSHTQLAISFREVQFTDVAHVQWDLHVTVDNTCIWTYHLVER